MASNLDLQEQEQLDELKAFWKQYGNLITWTLTLALAGLAAFNGWNWWQREQGAKAAAMYDELDRAVQAGNADQAARVFGDLKDRHGRTSYATQAGLVTAQLQADKGQADAAQATLAWVVDKAGDDETRALAQLQLAGLLLDKKAFDEALKQLDAIQAPEFAALASDRRGDVLLASGKAAEAVQAFRTAWQGLPATSDYRRVVEAKLTALGAAPDEAAAAAAAASGVAQ
ncbi:MAG: tetratricopeptide repeat protein [Burkholderiales bacterium]|nr:tetratricopeptide repeat protein [Burkholderiales bacterium]